MSYNESLINKLSLNRNSVAERLKTAQAAIEAIQIAEVVDSITVEDLEKVLTATRVAYMALGEVPQLVRGMKPSALHIAQINSNENDS